MGFWAQLILGIFGFVGFLLAISPFVQMYYRRPKIQIDFCHTAIDDGILLECKLTNKPIHLLLSRILGIQRETADDVWVGLHITKYVGGKSFLSEVSLVSPVQLFREGSEPSKHVSLATSELPLARFIVVFRRPSSSEVKLAKEEGVPPQILAKGKYFAEVLVFVSGKRHVFIKQFVIHKDGTTHWLNN